MVALEFKFQLCDSADPFWSQVTDFPGRDGISLQEVEALPPFEQHAGRLALINGLESGRLQLVTSIGSVTFKNSAHLIFDPTIFQTTATWSKAVVIGARGNEWCYHHTLREYSLVSPLNPVQIIESADLLQRLGFFEQVETPADTFGHAHQLESWTSGTNYVVREHSAEALETLASLEGERTSLERAPHEAWRQDWSSIKKRRTSVIVGGSPLTLTQLGHLLDLTLSAEAAGERTKRGYPSAGAFYPLHAFLTWQRALYLYHPTEHSLVKLARFPEAKETNLYFAGSPRELEKKYRQIPHRLMLLNTGVIYQQIALGAAVLGLQGHAYGGGPNRAVERLIRHSFPTASDIYGQYVIAGKIP